MPATQLRNFCVTLNNFTDTDVEQLKSFPASYIILAEETGATGTTHIQGCIELEKRISFAKVKKTVPRAHIEPRKGNAKQAAGYCKKGATPPESSGANYESFVDTPGPDYKCIFEAGALSCAGHRTPTLTHSKGGTCRPAVPPVIGFISHLANTSCRLEFVPTYGFSL